MRRTFPARGSLRTAPIITFWVVFIVANMVAIQQLVIFAAVVYPRIAFDLLSPKSVGRTL